MALKNIQETCANFTGDFVRAVPSPNARQMERAETRKDTAPSLLLLTHDLRSWCVQGWLTK